MHDNAISTDGFNVPSGDSDLSDPHYFITRAMVD
jgi:hypothetical protein